MLGFFFIFVIRLIWKIIYYSRDWCNNKTNIKKLHIKENNNIINPLTNNKFIRILLAVILFFSISNQLFIKELFLLNNSNCIGGFYPFLRRYIKIICQLYFQRSRIRDLWIQYYLIAPIILNMQVHFCFSSKCILVF